MDKLRSFIGDEFTAVPQGEHYLEIVPTGCSKAEGIHILQKNWEVPKDNMFMPLGNSENDIPMLEAVPHSIAMGVCSKTILPYCSYRTTPVLEDGIANALKHYGLI